MNREPVATLLIEDDEAFTLALKAILENAPCYIYDVTPVRTLRESLHELGKRDFDLILLDLRLPDAEEAQAVVAIREVSEDTPLVVITGLEEKRVQDAAFAAMVADYIVKPCGSEEIRHRVRTAVAAHRAGRRFAKMDKAIERADQVMERCEKDPTLPPYDVPAH